MISAIFYHSMIFACARDRKTLVFSRFFNLISRENRLQ